MKMKLIKINIQDIIDKLSSEDRPIIFIDTCSIIDIIRAPIRDGIIIVETLNKYLNSIEDSISPINFILPSYFEKEFNEHYDDTKKEVYDTLNKAKLKIKYIDDINGKLNIKSKMHNDIVFDETINTLDFMTEYLLLFSCILDDTLRFSNEAMLRMGSNIAPSKKGKESIKDCHNFEELLFISKNLRVNGFSKAIIFCSSNKNDYYKDSKLNPYIKNELDCVNVIFTTDLSWAFHECGF